MQQETFKLEPAEDWLIKRLGKFTSSNINKLLKSGRGGKPYFGDGAITYIEGKVAEMLTQEKNELKTIAIQWGEEHEEDAFLRFVDKYGKNAEYYGKKNPVFIEWSDEAGGSPDGWIDSEKAVIELKCPYESTNHVKALQINDAEGLRDYNEDYYVQLQANMFFADAKKGYFVSYDPRTIDYRFAVHSVEVLPDLELWKELATRIEEGVKVKKSILAAIGYYY